MKKITITLDPSSVEDAIKEIKAYRDEFNRKLVAFAKAIAERGVEIAKLQIVELGAFDSGTLAGSIAMRIEGNKGIIFTNCPWAAYVEIGTGIVGSANPHPTMPWAYNVNNHEKGWVYYDERRGQFRFTSGMPSRPFMYLTAQQLQREAGEIAKQFFGGDQPL